MLTDMACPRFLRYAESRHRKCPGCGVGFGQGDVKHFFFT